MDGLDSCRVRWLLRRHSPDTVGTYIIRVCGGAGGEGGAKKIHVCSKVSSDLFWLDESSRAIYRLQISGCLSEKSGSMRINTFPMKDLHNGRSPMSYEQHKDAPVSKPHD